MAGQGWRGEAASVLRLTGRANGGGECLPQLANGGGGWLVGGAGGGAIACGSGGRQ